MCVCLCFCLFAVVVLGGGVTLLLLCCCCFWGGALGYVGGGGGAGFGRLNRRQNKCKSQLSDHISLHTNFKDIYLYIYISGAPYILPARGGVGSTSDVSMIDNYVPGSAEPVVVLRSRAADHGHHQFRFDSYVGFPATSKQEDGGGGKSVICIE